MATVDQVPLPTELWEWARALGPAGFVVIAWWLERKERQDLQKRNDLLVDRIQKVSEDATSAVKSLRDLLMSVNVK